MSRGEVLVAMSGGVDSSVAAERLVEAGYDVTGVTMRLWGGEADRGCCSISDVHDARRVADQLGIEHHVFNFSDDFDRHVVEPFARDHARGRTPNPCIECNRHLKFDLLLRRADVLGFERVATGHHARIVDDDGVLRLRRGADPVKDQSYVLHMLDQAALARCLFPIGHLDKSEVRAIAERAGLRTASKAESQDVCFIRSDEGRAGFLSSRIDYTPADVVDRDGAVVGSVDAVQLVTIGQRKGLGTAGGTSPRYIVDVDVEAARVTIGERGELDSEYTPVTGVAWSHAPIEEPVLVQCSAHGDVARARVSDGRVAWDEPHRRVAPGQSVVFYLGDLVVGGATAA